MAISREDKRQPMSAAVPIGKAIVLFAHGRGYAICAQLVGGDDVTAFASDYGVNEDGFDFEACGIDHAKHTDGIWVGDLSVVDDGEGDWPGSRECAVQFSNAHPATAEEWRDHCEGLWPWDLDAEATK